MGTFKRSMNWNHTWNNEKREFRVPQHRTWWLHRRGCPTWTLGALYSSLLFLLHCHYHYHSTKTYPPIPLFFFYFFFFLLSYYCYSSYTPTGTDNPCNDLSPWPHFQLDPNICKDKNDWSSVLGSKRWRTFFFFLILSFKRRK